jgi:hypothetical protein
MFSGVPSKADIAQCSRHVSNRSGDSRTMQCSKQSSTSDRPFPEQARANFAGKVALKVSRIDPLMHAIINDKNCRFLAVFEKLSVVFMAQRFNVYSSTIPSKFPQCLQD